MIKSRSMIQCGLLQLVLSWHSGTIKQNYYTIKEIRMITTCVECDGDGRTPSNVYREWRKCPDEFLDEFNKSYPDESCCSCSGVGHREYKDEEAYFNALADKYEKDTIHLSNPCHDHPSYVKMISLGKKSIPWTLRRVQREETWLFSLLWHHIDEDEILITQEMRGRLQLIRNACIKWGKEKGHIE